MKNDHLHMFIGFADFHLAFYLTSWIATTYLILAYLCGTLYPTVSLDMLSSAAGIGLCHIGLFSLCVGSKFTVSDTADSPWE